MNNSNLYHEKELFRRIAEGDQEAFAEFYLLIKTDCSAYAHRVLDSREAAQEVMQESMIRLWLHRDKLADVDLPRSWFYRLVANECVRYLTKHGFREFRHEHPVTSDLNHTDQIISYRETQRIVASAVASLPPKRRAIYQLSRDHGLTQFEIAEQLGVSRDYVKKALIIALQVIRRRLIDEGIFLPVIIFLLF